jgi:cellulose synthase/poly-beta-1,6-N-acetylglucosamine synthase-like glycosyltransferase
MDLRGLFEYFLVSFIAAILVLEGFFEASNPLGFEADLPVIFVEVVMPNSVGVSLFLSLCFIAASFMIGRELFSKSSIPKTLDGEMVEVIVPVYEGENVVSRAVESIKKTNYENFRINIVCEPGDEECIEVVEGLECELVINQHPGSKAGAINTVFEKRNDSNYFALFDADEIVNEDFIPSGVGYLEQGHQVFQGRRVPIPKSFIEKFAYCERALYHTLRKLTEITTSKNAKSSSTVLTRKAWEKVEGFNDVVTEDVDFEYECYAKDIDVKTDRRCTNQMEAPHSLKDFWGQRKKWSIGHIDILAKALKGNYESGSVIKGAIISYRAITVALIPIFLLIWVSKIALLILLDYNIVFITTIISSALGTYIISFYDKDEEIDFIGSAGLLSFLIIPVTGLIRAKSIFEYLLSWDGEWYEVEKGGGP